MGCFMGVILNLKITKEAIQDLVDIVNNKNGDIKNVLADFNASHNELTINLVREWECTGEEYNSQIVFRFDD